MSSRPSWFQRAVVLVMLAAQASGVYRAAFAAYRWECADGRPCALRCPGKHNYQYVSQPSGFVPKCGLCPISPGGESFFSRSSQSRCVLRSSPGLESVEPVRAVVAPETVLIIPEAASLPVIRPKFRFDPVVTDRAPPPDRKSVV